MTNLPTLIEAEIDTMVDTVAHWVDHVGAVLTSDAGHLLLRNQIRKMLREGAIETLKVVTAAEQGHQDADLALRELGAEMLDRGEMPNATLRSYLVKALVTAPVPYPPGRNIADTWVRDIGIAVMVAMVMMHWPYLRSPAIAPPSGPAPRPLWPSPCANTGTHSPNGRSSASPAPQQACGAAVRINGRHLMRTTSRQKVGTSKRQYFPSDFAATGDFAVENRIDAEEARLDKA